MPHYHEVYFNAAIARCDRPDDQCPWDRWVPCPYERTGVR